MRLPDNDINAKLRQTPDARAASLFPRSAQWTVGSIVIFTALILGARVLDASSTSAKGEHASQPGSTSAKGEQVSEPESTSPESPENRPRRTADRPFLEVLEEKAVQLRDMEKALKDRENRIVLAEQEIASRLEKLTAMRDEIAQLFKKEEDERTQRLKSFTLTLASMKPDQAAQLLAQMDSAVALRVMAELPQEQLTKMLERMDKPTAARLSTDFVRQKKAMPTAPSGGIP